MRNSAHMAIRDDDSMGRDRAKKWPLGHLLVGRSAERPDRELLYVLRGHLGDGRLALSLRGSDQPFTGVPAMFHEYGARMKAVINPVLVATPPEQREAVRERMLADLNWRWDAHGLRESGRQMQARFVDPSLLKASPEVLAEVFGEADRRSRS